MSSYTDRTIYIDRLYEYMSAMGINSYDKRMLSIVDDMANKVARFNTERDTTSEDEALLFVCLFEPHVDFSDNIRIVLDILRNHSNNNLRLTQYQIEIFETTLEHSNRSRIDYIVTLKTLDIYQLWE